MRGTRRDLLVMSGLATGSLSGLLKPYTAFDNKSDEASNETDEASNETDDVDDSETEDLETVTDLSIDFNDWNWLDEFTEREFVGHVDLITEEVYDERSLRVDIPEGESEGTSLHYLFAEESSEPEELLASYYIYFPESFDPKDQVGKLPGPAGTYNNAGWGGRPSNGENGWSARMGFRPGGDDEIGLDYYVYHADMDGDFGDLVQWDRSLTKGQWYRIDQHIRLNDPEGDNGILSGWVDGNKAYEWRDIRFRETSELKIENYWFTVYWGGKDPSPADNHILFDNLRVLTRP